MAPMGFRFNPTDQEKISYLLRKVTGMPLPCNNFIGTADLYGENEPWEIFGDANEDELYFFTTLKKVGNKKKNNDEYKRFSRNVGKGGTWSNKGQKIPIIGKRGGLIGHKKCFRYVSSKNEDDRINGIWLLKEYTLSDNIASKNVKVKDEYKDCVLVLLKRKKKKMVRRDEDQSPRVESGLVDNYEVLSGSDTDNLETTSMRDFAKCFVEEEKSKNLEMMTTRSDDQDIIMGCSFEEWCVSSEHEQLVRDCDEYMVPDCTIDIDKIV